MRMPTLVLVFVCAFVAMPAYAAHLYLAPASASENRLDTFYVPVRIDAQGECLNAVEVAIAYDPTEISIRDIATGDSILTLWTTWPTVEKDVAGHEVGRVTFAGGIPGGYCGRVEGDPGRTDVLATLVVSGVPQALHAGEVTTTSLIVEPQSSVYRHDGSGEKASLTFLGADLVLMQSTSTPNDVWLTDVRADTIAPEFFEITLVRGPSAGHQRHYIVFSTTDKQSGIDHYEVLETDPDRFGFLSWISREAYWSRVESPYVLRDQHLRSKIMVKAVDKNGNERIASYTPPLSLAAELSRPLNIVLFLVIAGLLLLVWFVAARFKRKRTPAVETQEESDGYLEEEHL
jgi:hypothetical protein